MNRFPALPFVSAALLASAVAGLGQGSDPIGLQALRGFDPTLTGTGVIVAQVEANSGTGTADDYEVNPNAVGQAASKFEYTGSNGSTASVFPNKVGVESTHADEVGEAFYGDVNKSNPEGVAPGVKEIDSYDGGYFLHTIVPGLMPINAKIVNESFTADSIVDQSYDNYAAKYNTLFISAVGNSGGIGSPASCFNGIGVAAYGSPSGTGPTYDGRSKPDITAPGNATSVTAPLVAGAAADLLEAAERGDAGAGTTADASDSRVIKVALLNGAIKPPDWTHTGTAPLDTRYGAGILNVYNSYMNLRAGEHGISGATAGPVAAISSGSLEPEEGWDLATMTTAYDGTSSYINESNHYLFNLTAATAPAFTLTSTLTWWRQNGQTKINNLDLYLFDATTGATIAVSDSTVDNVQQIYAQDLAPGEYDLVVEKVGGTVVSASETYGLAFDFAPVPEPSAWWLLILGVAAAPWMKARLAKG